MRFPKYLLLRFHCLCSSVCLPWAPLPLRYGVIIVPPRRTFKRFCPECFYDSIRYTVERYARRGMCDIAGDCRRLCRLCRLCRGRLDALVALVASMPWLPRCLGCLGRLDALVAVVAVVASMPWLPWSPRCLGCLGCLGCLAGSDHPCQRACVDCRANMTEAEGARGRGGHRGKAAIRVNPLAIFSAFPPYYISIYLYTYLFRASFHQRHPRLPWRPRSLGTLDFLAFLVVFDFLASLVVFDFPCRLWSPSLFLASLHFLGTLGTLGPPSSPSPSWLPHLSLPSAFLSTHKPAILLPCNI